MKRRAFWTLATALCVAACSHEQTNEASTASSEQKIVNGQNESNFPAAGALVIYDDYNDEYYERFCSGTLIRSNWVLTAGHCDLQNDVGLDNIWFLVGEHAEESYDRSIPEGSTLYPVKRIIHHPLYNSFTVNYDIGLVELDESITGVDPIPLFDGDLNAHVGSEVKAIGYGVTAYGSEENDARRRSTDLQILKVYDANYIVQGENSGICNGDSGGPDLINIDGQWQVCGVHSIGVLSDEEEPSVSDACLYPSGMTRVDAFRSWILQNIGEEADCRQDPSLCHCAKACRDDGQCEPYFCGEHSTCYEAIIGEAHSVEEAIASTGAIYQLSPQDHLHFRAIMECANSYVFDPDLYEACNIADIVCESQALDLGTGDASCAETVECMAGCGAYDDDCAVDCNDASKETAGRHAQAYINCSNFYECGSLEPDDSCMLDHCAVPIQDCYGEDGDDDDDNDGGLGPGPIDGGSYDAEIDAEVDASDAELITDGGNEDAGSDAVINIDAGGEDASDAELIADGGNEDASSDAVINIDAGGEDASGEDATSDASEDAGSADASDDASAHETDATANADSGSGDAAKPSEKDADSDSDDGESGEEGCSATPGTHHSSWLAFLGLPLLLGRRRQKA